MGTMVADIVKEWGDVNKNASEGNKKVRNYRVTRHVHRPFYRALASLIGVFISVASCKRFTGPLESAVLYRHG